MRFVNIQFHVSLGLSPVDQNGNQRYILNPLLALCQQGSFLFWAKGLPRFWLMGSNQPGRRGHPRLGFPAASVFAIMLLLKFLGCKASNVEKFS